MSFVYNDKLQKNFNFFDFKGKPENGTSVPETSSFSTSTSKAPSIDTTEVKSTSAVTTTVSVCSSVPITVTQVSTKTQDDNSGTKENAVAVGGAKREIQSSPQPNKQWVIVKSYISCILF